MIRKIKNRGKDMGQTVCNPQKGRLETINFELTKENTTWFDDIQGNEEIYWVADFQGGLIIKGLNYEYPVYIYDISRADVGYDIDKIVELKEAHMTI